MVTTVDELVERARAGVHRPGPAEAHRAAAEGALLVDIRPAAQRSREGGIPGALVIERNVLEWRLDPTGSHRIPEATGYGLTVIVVCSEGYASSLAAAGLRELGLHRATDLDGGFAAWAAAGLPTVAGTAEGPEHRSAPLGRTSGNS
ncbi:rhodanese-like domain-containing protein [Kitasatospora sp. HPMI-4]|uniref:rhodanese-like domain-containing protein n=1 Tax=Kitasatospora sp. HPMI-4 TaxID=3448443 RepID=UPI003F1D521B